MAIHYSQFLETHEGNRKIIEKETYSECFNNLRLDSYREYFRLNFTNFKLIVCDIEIVTGIGHFGTPQKSTDFVRSRKRLPIFGM